MFKINNNLFKKILTLSFLVLISSNFSVYAMAEDEAKDSSDVGENYRIVCSGKIKLPGERVSGSSIYDEFAEATWTDSGLERIASVYNAPDGWRHKVSPFVDEPSASLPEHCKGKTPKKAIRELELDITAFKEWENSPNGVAAVCARKRIRSRQLQIKAIRDVCATRIQKNLRPKEPVASIREGDLGSGGAAVEEPRDDGR